MTIWLARIPAGSSWHIPAGSAQALRSLYVPHSSTDVVVGGEELPAGSVGLIVADREHVVHAPAGGEVLLLGGRPIGETVVQYGPFVMNTEEEIHRTFADYRTTGFGGWPWDTDDPAHGTDAGRFAVHPDSTLDEPPEGREG